jgi:hypothetical protein
MNFFLLALTTLITLAPGRADRAPESAPSNFSGNKEWGEVQSLFNFTDVQIAALPSKPATDAVWENAKCKGELFTHASKLDADKAVGSFPYITSPWDGDLTDELKIWGYSDVSEPSSAWGMCSFDFPWDIKSAFVALGINHKSSKMKGPNKCFDVTHRDGPAIERPPNGKLPEVEDQYYTVNNKRYRVSRNILRFFQKLERSLHPLQATGAKFLIGVNPTDGCVYFMNRKSPESAAKETWWDMNPAKDDLPALRASSDIAWGLWNRMSCGSNINKFFSMHIVNEETMSLIRRALNAKDVEQATRWPGTTFEAGSDAFSALLGI